MEAWWVVATTITADGGEQQRSRASPPITTTKGTHTTQPANPAVVSSPYQATAPK